MTDIRMRHEGQIDVARTICAESDNECSVPKSFDANQLRGDLQVGNLAGANRHSVARSCSSASPLHQYSQTIAPTPQQTLRALHRSNGGREIVSRCGPPSIPLIDRFWSKVDRNGPVHPVLGTRCWLWMSTLQRGYGQIALCRNGAHRQRRVWAHRIMWELTHGAIPDGLVICHRCDVPRCVNPDHLFLGTQLDNVADAIAKGRLTGRPRRASRQPATDTVTS